MINYPTDSPLSITSSIAGILTFLAAILAAIYVRFTYLRNADSEYFQVKTSLNWFKTESTFMHDLVSTSSLPLSSRFGDEDGEDEMRGRGGRRTGKEREMYAFVVEQLGKLEERLLECLAEAEEGVDRKTGRDGSGEKGGWTIVPRSVRGRTDIAMSWLLVRAKALELVRQRDALGSRVLFAQMSMISERVRDQETKSRKGEQKQRDRLERLEKMVHAQHEKLDRLEDLMYRIMHRDRVNHPGEEQRSTPRRSETEATLSNPDGDEMDDPSYSQTIQEDNISTKFYPIPDI
ncbi:hypothetical protein N431DRAFT_456332 [Stipitochalara longipes BDJ]|nr:hypothetical protein N431DRAFT_456332 [Stipitochalara longipes BDJ]